MHNSVPDRPAGPLAGLRVVEVSSFVAGPLAGMTLAQLGAEVIRVDPPGGAADIGRWPLTAAGASLYWTGLNKGKLSVELDLREESGRQAIRDLLVAAGPRSAVLLTNITGWEWLTHVALAAHRPDLIHVEIRGNRDGTTAVDYTVNAETGFPLVTGHPDAAGPVNHVLPAWDLACGLYAAFGIAAAARRRELSGEGESIRVALSDVALATAGNLGFLAEAQVNGANRPRIGNHLYGSFARDFVCSDGSAVMVVALTLRHWRDLVELTGVRPRVEELQRSLGVDFAVEGERYRHRETLAALMEPWFAGIDAPGAARSLQSTTIPWAPYRSFGEVVSALQSGAPNPIMTTVDQPGVGPHLVPSSPLELGSGNLPARAAPVLGADTVAVLGAIHTDARRAARRDDEDKEPACPDSPRRPD